MLSQETREEAAAELLDSYQQTLNNLAQKDVRIDKFHGRDNEDIRNKHKKTHTHTNQTGFVALVEIRRTYSELSRDKGQTEKKRNVTLLEY